MRNKGIYMQLKKKNKIQHKIMFWAIIIFVIYVLFPFTRVLPNVIKGAWIFASFLLSLIAIFFNKSKNKLIYLCLIILPLIINLLIFLGEYNQSNNFSFVAKYIVMFAFWLPFLYGAWYSDNYNVKYVNRIKKVMLVCILITCLTTMIGQILYPDASRLLADNETEAHRFYQVRNIGGYGFSYAIALSVPFLIRMFKIEKKPIYIISTLIIGLTIALQKYVFAIIIYLILLFASVLLLQNNKKLFFKRTFISLFFFLLIYLLILRNEAFWKFALKIFENNEVLYQRIGDLYHLFVSKRYSGDISYRSVLYSYSIDAFQANPLLGSLFGMKYEKLSGHSEVLDYLGGTGMFGMFFLIAYIIALIVKFKNKDIMFCDKVALLLTIAMILLLAILNTIIGSIEISTIFAFEYLLIFSYNSRLQKIINEVLKHGKKKKI